MVFQNQILAGASGAGDYEIDYSCRFDGTSAYMTRTPAGAGNRMLWTQSAWIKRCKLDAWQTPFMNTDTGGNDGSVMHLRS